MGSDTLRIITTGQGSEVMLDEVFTRRFAELESKFKSIPFRSESYGSPHATAGDWKQWATSAQSLILKVFGEGTPHYQNFLIQFNACSGSNHDVNALRGIFLSAKDDFEGGYVFDVDLRVSGEVFGDFIGLAKQSLAEGNKDVAAVLACAALEDALKRFALANDLSVEDKGMQDVVNALKGAGLVAGAQKSLLDAMPRIRNFALHANWDKISEPDVGSVLAFVEQFLLTKFSAP